MGIASILKSIFKLNGEQNKTELIKIKVGQIVTYKSYCKDELDKGKVTRIFEVTDSIDKQDIGKKLAYVQEESYCLPTLVNFEDIVKVGE